MIEVDIPGYTIFQFRHLVLDVNGTIARDGQLIDGVGELLTELRSQLDILSGPRRRSTKRCGCKPYASASKTR